VIADVLPIAAVLDDERFVAAVSSDHRQNGAIVVGSSIATIAVPSADTRRCNNAPSDASDEIAFRILLINTPGFAAAGIAAVSFARCAGVAFSVELTDLDWGSWEGSLPESSSLGGDAAPLRGAFILVLSGFKNSLPGRLYQLCRAGDILVATASRRLGPFWSDQMAQSFTAADTKRRGLRRFIATKSLTLLLNASLTISLHWPPRLVPHLWHGSALSTESVNGSRLKSVSQPRKSRATEVFARMPFCSVMYS
jgi:hypothetical protein